MVKTQEHKWSLLKFAGLFICYTPDLGANFVVCACSINQPCDAMDCSPPGSCVHGILQARILEWVAMPSSRGSSQPRARAQVSCIAGGFFTTELPGKPKYPFCYTSNSNWNYYLKKDILKIHLGNNNKYQKHIKATDKHTEICSVMYDSLCLYGL